MRILSPRRPVRHALGPVLATLAIAGAATLAVAANQQKAAPTLPAPVTEADFRDPGPNAKAQIALGKALFYDKILSGNRNIACASCHHPKHGTADGLSLSVGEGGRGLGPARDTGAGHDAVTERVPRNAPALFNLGAVEFTDMFHDGRVAMTPDGLVSPAGDALPDGLESVVAAQALFPVTSPGEMAGQAGENPVADAAAAGDLPRVWDLLADRLRAIPEYVEMFEAAYGVGADDITMVHAANAIAVFEADAWRADQSPFDRYLRGETHVLSSSARRGMELFYGEAGCSGCHAGKFQTDHSYHAIGMPQIGPGKGDGAAGHEDFGRERVTGQAEDRYAFRTPSLRNVTLTAPYGHAGSYATLEDVILHHVDPEGALASFDRDQLRMPRRPDLDASDFRAFDDPVVRASVLLACDPDLPHGLDKAVVGDLVAFLRALTDPRMRKLEDTIPETVPSGLPVAD